MNSLISALIEKKAFVKDTIITASYQSTDLFGRTYNKSGEFKVARILKGETSPVFELINVTGTSKMVIRAKPEEIKAVDGMDICRFADVYDLLPDGSSKKVGRKRGRKPKSRLTE